MYNDAVQAVQESLNHKNPIVRFKSASWLIEKLEKQKIGETNPRNQFREMSTSNFIPDVFDHFDESKYKKLCKEYGIKP